ncbi:MAG: N-acetylmuramic acid 6-phosphate etherase [Acidobacteria bacterium]|nr:N-acetylmuramic acid 6-phosphate etherase [Acidobacteriota bacterium]
MRSKTKQLSATEQRNPRSRDLDKKSTREILSIINREDASVARAVARETSRISRAVDQIVVALRNSGRLIYVGAGTSGRLAVLDASEIPPTFGVPSTMIQGTIAGGRRALTDAIEGAEDDFAQAGRDLRARKLSRKDVVVALTASGSTPYALGAMEYAKKIGSHTVAITCNRRTKISKVATITIAPQTGPEVITGSTRMKAGTAQKLVLNMLSTAVMARLGHVYSNLMINVAQTNQKLRRRAVRILEQAAAVDVSTAEHALRHAGYDLRVALVSLKCGLNASEAKSQLRAARGNLRRALKE